MMNRPATIAMLCAVFCLAVLAGGCFSVNEPPAPNFREVSLPPLEAGRGRLFFYHPDIWFPAAGTTAVALNDETLTENLRSLTVWSVDLPPGAYTLKFGAKTLALAIAAGHSTFVRLSGEGALVGAVNAEQVDPAVGRREIANLKYRRAEFD